jgi:hypothetical protein
METAVHLYVTTPQTNDYQTAASENALRKRADKLQRRNNVCLQYLNESYPLSEKLIFAEIVKIFLEFYESFRNATVV